MKFEFNAETIGEISDGYHTFDELYHHRMIMFALICNQNKSHAWKSLKHNDGTMFEGNYFICGIETPEGQFTYHYELPHWDLFDVRILDRAPEWDGHTAKDVGRLLSLLEDKFKPGDRVCFTYKRVKTIGIVKYRLTGAAHEMRDPRFTGHYVVHSPGMSSTLPEEKLKLMKE